MSREIAELNLISEFNKLDLNNQPFSNWLSSHPPTPHNLHTHLTEEEVDWWDELSQDQKEEIADRHGAGARKGGSAAEG